jgi:phosphoglycolate phosphatase-like HAD superfamily hydrolase
VNRPKCLVLDWDGTVADTMPVLTDIAVSLMTKWYELEPDRAKRMYVETTGLPFVQQIALMFPDNPRNMQVVEEFEQRKKETFFDQRLFPDVIPVLKALSAASIPVAVSSSTVQPLIEEYINRNGMKNLIGHILGFCPGFEKGRDHFTYLVKKMGSMAFSDLLYVGDSLKDGERARNCGVPFIARVGMVSKDDFLAQFPGTTCIGCLEELTGLLGL